MLYWQSSCDEIHAAFYWVRISYDSSRLSRGYSRTTINYFNPIRRMFRISRNRRCPILCLHNNFKTFGWIPRHTKTNLRGNFDTSQRIYQQCTIYSRYKVDFRVHSFELLNIRRVYKITHHWNDKIRESYWSWLENTWKLVSSTHEFISNHNMK